MVKLVTGGKGKGKTKVMIDLANERIKTAKGSAVYIDHSNHHMFELDKKLRLINVKEFNIETKDEIIGFMKGIISQDRDLELMFIDGLLKLPSVEFEDVNDFVTRMGNMCAEHNIELTISVSADVSDLNEDLQKLVVKSL